MMADKNVEESRSRVFNGTRCRFVDPTHTTLHNTPALYTICRYAATNARDARDMTIKPIQVLLIQQITPVEAPRRSIVQIEVPIRTEVFAGKELAIRPGDEPHQLLVAELVELLGRDGFTDSEFERFHKLPLHWLPTNIQYCNSG